MSEIPISNPYEQQRQDPEYIEELVAYCFDKLMRQGKNGAVNSFREQVGEEDYTIEGLKTFLESEGYTLEELETKFNIEREDIQKTAQLIENSAFVQPGELGKKYDESISNRPLLNENENERFKGMPIRKLPYKPSDDK